MSQLVIKNSFVFDKKLNQLAWRVDLTVTTSTGDVHCLLGCQPSLHDIEHLLVDMGFSEEEEDFISSLCDEDSCPDIYFEMSEQQQLQYAYFEHDLTPWLDLFTVWTVDSPVVELKEWISVPVPYEIVVTFEDGKLTVLKH